MGALPHHRGNCSEHWLKRDVLVCLGLSCRRRNALPIASQRRAIVSPIVRWTTQQGANRTIELTPETAVVLR
jgi:hypothetical protein